MATGTRVSTICEIKLKDINYTKKEISLRHMKGKQQLIIPLSTQLEAVIKEFIRIWRSGDGVTPESYLFANIGEEQLTRNALYHSYSNYCKANGINTTSVHAIRHTFAKQFVKNHGDVFTLQKILGHKKLDMTKKYVELFSEDIKEGYDAVSPLDNIKRSQKRTQVVKKNND
jgi:integrase/recombinase XerD